MTALRNFLTRLRTRAFAPVDIASLVFFRIAFGLVAAVALLSLPPYWRLSRNAGVAVSGRPTTGSEQEKQSFSTKTSQTGVHKERT